VFAGLVAGLVASSETAKPSFKSSPWILGAPQSEFSCAMRRISTRISSVIALQFSKHKINGRLHQKGGADVGVLELLTMSFNSLLGLK
jgi:hypothetical protein